MQSLGVTIREVSIKAACLQHFEDIGHDPQNHNVVYENSQARERTQILMDVANKSGGMVIGTVQTYEYFDMIQDRILSFVSGHSRISYEELKGLMHNTQMLTRDLGTVLVGEEAVRRGLIDEVGGIKEALKKLYSMTGKQPSDH